MMNAFLRRARTASRTAAHLIEYGDPIAAGSRVYYAVFDAMRAVLDHQGIDTADIKTHHGLILSSEMNVVKPGRVPREIARVIQKAAELRWASDYSPESDVSADNVRTTLHEVSIFIDACAAIVEKGTDAP